MKTPSTEWQRQIEDEGELGGSDKVTCFISVFNEMAIYQSVSLIPLHPSLKVCVRVCPALIDY